MSCFLYQLKCCFGPFGCSCLCIRPVRLSTTTRSMYSIMLIIVSVIMILVHHEATPSYLQKKFGPKMNQSCIIIQASDLCERLFGYMSVYRIAYSFFLFHGFMALLCILVYTENNWRAKIHNGFWFFKILFICGIWVTLYLFPIIEQYRFVATIVGVCAAFIFIICQHVSLIDCAYEFNGYLRNKAAKNCCYSVLLIISTIFLYLCSIFGYLLLFVSFAIPEPCKRNRVIIAVNAGATLLLVLISLCIKERSKYKLYLPAAVTSVFVTFITWTAISSSPNQIVPKTYSSMFNNSFVMIANKDNTHSLHCIPNSLIFWTSSASQQSSYQATPRKISKKLQDFKRELHAYIGIFIMLAAAVYSSIRSTSEYKRYGIKPARNKYTSQPALPVLFEDVELEEIKTKSRNRRSGSFLAPIVEGESISNNSYTNTSAILKTTSMPSLTLQKSKISNVHKSSSSSFTKSTKNNNDQQQSSKSNKSKKYNKMESLRSAQDLNPIAEMEYENIDTLRNYPIDRFLIHDEHMSTRYSYSWLHFVFSLAYLFVMVQLTNWYSPETSHVLQSQESWPSTWMKLTTAWVALILFGWTLLCPAFCIGRRLYEQPIDSMRRQLKHNNSSKKQKNGAAGDDAVSNV